MQLPVTVTALQRTGGTVLSEVSIGAKLLKTPILAPKIKNNWEFRIVCDNIELEQLVSAVVFDIHSANDILRERKMSAPQRNLSLEVADKNYDRLAKEVIQIIDPDTEAFYWNLPIRNKILKVVGFEKGVEDILKVIDFSHYNGRLREIVSQKLLWSYVDSFVNRQALLGADIIIPPSFMVSGSGTPIDLLHQVHKRTADLLSMGRFKADIGAYVPILPKVFSTPKKQTIDEMIDFIRNVMPFRRFLFLKVAYYKALAGDKAARMEYRAFLEEIDTIKKELGNKFIVFLLDAGAEGCYTLTNGVDVYCEPVDGINGILKGGSKKDDEDSVMTKHGAYLHPELGSIPFSRLLHEIGEDKILPCSCPACNRYHEQLGLDTPASEWNTSRRAHRINLRTRDIETLKHAVSEGNVSDIKYKIDRGEDRNLIDLIPSRTSREVRR
jgi:hypothetical protein